LRDRNNVLVSGPPATGKSRLLAELKHAFEWTPTPGYYPEEEIALPADAHAGELAPWLPSPKRSDRRVFATAFDQNTKQRDVLRGLVPVVDESATVLRFKVSEGTLYRAAEHALTENGTALVVVDEINRGPAVAAFGPSIVALESDKRLDADGHPTSTTQTFELHDDKDEVVDYALPCHLYIVAAMNQADTSVEPLDVAFLRRFAPYLLRPEQLVLEAHFGLTGSGDSLPNSPGDPLAIYTALVRAWSKVNERLALGRSEEYQLGHGALMLGAPPAGLPEAQAHAAACWKLIRMHVDEVFFGDTRGVAETIAAGQPGNPYTVEDTTFAGQPVVKLRGPRDLAGAQLYAALKAIAES
jgi:5-methylcytosine-specific restriction protein B